MGTFLDAQVSQNSGSFGAPDIAPTGTPALFGTLGLNVSAATTNLRVTFNATMTIASALALAATITVQVYRGGGPGVGTLVYTGIADLPVLGLGVLSITPFTFTGSDFDPPVTGGALEYQAYVSTTGIGLLVSRIGPESFNAAAYSD